MTIKIFHMLTMKTFASNFGSQMLTTLAPPYPKGKGGF